jgi:hypothetical protein
LTKSDELTALLRRYSEWKRRRLVNDSQLPFNHLIIKTTFFTACILVDGVVLPWIVIALQRTFVSYLLFMLCLGLMLLAQVRLYSGIKARWKKASEESMQPGRLPRRNH